MGKITNRARQLRRTMTKAEVRLWLRLKAMRSEGYHFRRQQPFKGYYLDFVSFNRKLVIELDGWRHAEDDQREHDQVKDAVLKREGFRVLRFWNHELDQGMDDVMIAICNALEALPTRPGATRRPTLPTSGREE